MLCKASIGTDLCIQSKIKLTQFQRGSVRGISRKRIYRTEQPEIKPKPSARFTQISFGLFAGIKETKQLYKQLFHCDIMQFLKETTNWIFPSEAFLQTKVPLCCSMIDFAIDSPSPKLFVFSLALSLR